MRKSLRQRSLRVIKEGQIKELRRLLDTGRTLTQAARMTEMDRKTARKYRDGAAQGGSGKSRNYRTRDDPFSEDWPKVVHKLEREPGLKAYALFDWLQQNSPGRYPDSNRRTFERRVAAWKAQFGPGKKVMFEQVHRPGETAASDFTVCNSLGVKIAGQPFEHTLFHCVLTYSNFETVTLCHSESFEALSAGVQDAFFKFGGVPQRHRTDSLAAAVRNHSSRKQLTQRYEALMDHYRCQPQTTNARCANENGDIESLNGKIKDRIDQALVLRGSRSFESIPQYVEFLAGVVERANANRQAKFLEERSHLKALPALRLDTDDYMVGVRVSKHSTIRVRNQAYSVPSRLIDSKVNVRVTVDSIVVSVGDVIVETMPRLIGKGVAAINYRHIIDSLIRKPGAFANYRYHEQMFPRTVFRIAYDVLGSQHTPRVRDRGYLEILHLAAKESEESVALALTSLIDTNQPITAQRVRELLENANRLSLPTDVSVPEVNLADYDQLVSNSNPINDKERQDESTKDNDNPASSQQTSDHTAEHDFKCIAQGDNGEPRQAATRPVSGTAFTELQGTLPEFSAEGVERRTVVRGILIGVDDARDRIAEGGAREAVAVSFEVAAGQDLGELRFRPSAPARHSQVGDATRRQLPGQPRECTDFRQARNGQEPRLVCTSGATDSPRSKFTVHNV